MFHFSNSLPPQIIMHDSNIDEYNVHTVDAIRIKVDRFPGKIQYVCCLQMHTESSDLTLELAMILSVPL